MKKLGQYFLIDKSAIKKIITALELKPNDAVIEIGPGHGELTIPLLAEPIAKLIAVEKDKNLARGLKSKIKSKKLEVIEGDILKILPKLKILNCKLKMAGNIPYYLTGYLFRLISELNNKPSLTVLTIQKEVAERLAARPPKMNLLAASVQFWSKPEIIGKIPAGSFRPKPKVDSAIVRLEDINQKPELKESYYKFIKILFKQPRKTIFNNLQAGPVGDEKRLKKMLTDNGIKEASRPQNLSLEQIKKLSLCYN